MGKMESADIDYKRLENKKSLIFINRSAHSYFSLLVTRATNNIINRFS